MIDNFTNFAMIQKFQEIFTYWCKLDVVRLKGCKIHSILRQQFETTFDLKQFERDACQIELTIKFNFYECRQSFRMGEVE